MSLLNWAELVGTFLSIGLAAYLLASVLQRQVRRLERRLILLLTALLLWWLGTLAVLVFQKTAWEGAASVVRLGEALSVAAASLLLPLHLHSLWTYYLRNFTPRTAERMGTHAALALLYGFQLLLPWALLRLWSLPDPSLLQRLGGFTFLFALLLAFSCLASAVLQRRIVERSDTTIEGELFRGLWPQFAILGILAGLTLAIGGWLPSGFSQPLFTLARLSPLALIFWIAHRVYVYRFLHDFVSRSLAAALLIPAVAVVDLTLARRLDEVFQRELGTLPYFFEAVWLAAALLFYPRLSRIVQRAISSSLFGRLGLFLQLSLALRRQAPGLASASLLTRRLQERMEARYPGVQASIHLDDVPPGPPQASFPLRPRPGRLLGYLQVRLSGATLGPLESQSLHLLAQEIAVVLNDPSLLRSQRQDELRSRQQSQMEHLGRMAATVAHNVKNPLSSMKTLMQLWSESSNLTDEQRREAGMMIAEVDRLSETVTNLLKFSRLEAEATVSGLRSVQLEDVLHKAAALFRADVESRGLQLRIEVDPPGALVMTDPNPLSDVLGNLISNAMEACDAGDEIRLEARAGVGGFRIDVRDNGRGIPSRIRAELFEPFVTSKTKGTGLGLAIVKKKVEQLGGEIELASTPDERGACFRMRFNLRASRAGSPASADSPA